MTIEIRKPSEEEKKMAEGWPTWSKEPSEFYWVYDNQERCLILRGKAEVTVDDDKKFNFGAGDWVVFPQGMECKWRIIEEIEKKYKFGD